MITMAASWLAAGPAVLTAIAVLLVPGLIATAPLRLGLFARVGLSTAASVLFLGVAGVVFGAVGVPFDAWQILVPAAATAPLVWIARRRLTGLLPGRDRVRWWWLVLAWLAAAGTLALIAFGGVPSPEQVAQTYDNVFHLAAVAHILETGDASSLTLRTIIETDRAWSFYPAAWHTIVASTVQLSGVSVPVAANAAWLAVSGVVWVPGVVWLAQVLLRRLEAGRVALVALPLSIAFGAMPYALLTWGTVYPTFLATALLPVAVAAPMSAWRGYDPAGGPAGSPRLLGAVGTLIAVGAISFAQPRVLVTWAVLLVPFAVASTVRAYRWAWAADGRSRRVAQRWAWSMGALVTAAAAAGFAYLVVKLDLFGRPLGDRLSGPQAQATQTVADGLWQVLSQSWLLGVDNAATFPAVLLAVVVVLGLVQAGRTRGLRWLVVAYLLFAVLFALAAGSDDLVAKLATALWYKDRYRLSSALPVFGVALATLGILTASRWVRRRRVGDLLAVGVAWVTAGTAVLGLTVVTGTVAFVFRLPERAATTEIVSQAQIDFMTTIAPIVPADQRLLGDPWDGSALSGLSAGREPVFPHVNGQWDADRLLVATQLADIDTEPQICAALDRLRIRYVLFNPHEFGGGDPAGNHFAAIHAAVGAGLFDEVATDGDSVLYRVQQCGALPAA